MQKGLILAAVALVLFGALLALSRDDDPPDDEHLILKEGPAPTEGNGFLTLVDAVEAMDWPEDDAWIYETPKREIADSVASLDLVDRNREMPSTGSPASSRLPFFGSRTAPSSRTLPGSVAGRCRRKRLSLFTHRGVCVLRG